MGESPGSAAEHPQGTWPRRRLLNVWIDDLTMEQLIDRLDAGVVFTLNLDHLYILQTNRDFYEAYCQADFVTADSRYVWWGLRAAGRRIQDKVSGSDLVPAFCNRRAADPATRVFYLGAAPGIAQRALERTNARVGRELVVGAHSPSMNFVNDEREIAEVVRIVNESGATVLIVGLGAPKQEVWIARNRHRMPAVKVFMGVGATIDYEADAVKRAPPWMRHNGLEWAYRVLSEPRRYWRRYVRDLLFFWWLALDAAGLYRSPWPPPQRDPGAGT